VEEEYRGRGIAGAVIQRLTQWFGEKNIEQVIIQVYSVNDSAVRAYRNAGFKDFVLQMRYAPD